VHSNVLSDSVAEKFRDMQDAECADLALNKKKEIVEFLDNNILYISPKVITMIFAAYKALDLDMIDPTIRLKRSQDFSKEIGRIVKECKGEVGLPSLLQHLDQSIQ